MEEAANKSTRTCKLKRKLFLKVWKGSGVCADFSQAARLIDKHFCPVGITTVVNGNSLKNNVSERVNNGVIGLRKRASCSSL